MSSLQQNLIIVGKRFKGLVQIGLPGIREGAPTVAEIDADIYSRFVYMHSNDLPM